MKEGSREGLGPSIRQQGMLLGFTFPFGFGGGGAVGVDGILGIAGSSGLVRGGASTARVGLWRLLGCDELGMERSTWRLLLPLMRGLEPGVVLGPWRRR